MSFNGAGTFVRLYSWVADKASAIKINASRMDAEMDGFAAGLSNCITKDGQTTLAADIPFNNRKITGLGNATADGDALNRTTGDGRYLMLSKGSAQNLSDTVNFAKGADIASAATTDIGAATGNYVTVTGTTTITALGTAQAGSLRVVRFAGALTLTHNATSLILPDGGNITTAAGDTAIFVSEGAGNWRCIEYRAVGGWISATVGAITAGTGAVANASGTYRYRKFGRTVFYQVDLTISNVGTAGTYIVIPLPFAAASNGVIPGRDNAASGKMLQGYTVTNSLFVYNYDGTFPASNGSRLVLSGTYEATS